MTQYKLVPVEPTTDMLRSGVQRELADASHYGRLRDTYRAMLAAAPEAPQPAKSAEQCWKCGDLDPAGHAKCNVPACGMREDTQPAKSAEQEPVEMSPEFTDTARAALAEPARMTPAELADRLKRGEKWQLAEQPAESLDGKLVMGLAVIRELTGTEKTDNIEATIEAVRKAVAPQPAERERLTRNEIERIYTEETGSFIDDSPWALEDFARAIIAAYERKNGIGGQT